MDRLHLKTLETISSYSVYFCYHNSFRQVVHKYPLRFYCMQNTWIGTMEDGASYNTWSCLRDCTVQWGRPNPHSSKPEPRQVV